MSPADQAAGVIAADHAFLERVGALTPEQQAGVQFPFGPMMLDPAEALGMRLNEHAMHTWDVEVVLDPSAVLSEQSASVMLQTLPIIVGFAAKDDGVVRELTIRTSEPTHELVLTSGDGSVSLSTGAGHGPLVDLPAEAFVRLVYGRLDVDHTPAGIDVDTIGALRPLFPGF
jgi:hypothetical protein